MAVPQNMDELGDMLQQMRDTISSLRQELGEEGRRRMLLEARIRGPQDTGVQGSKQHDMVLRKMFNKVPQYSGKAEEYDSWKFKMKI